MTRRVRELLDRFAAAEERFLRSEFLAPALPGGVVQVRIEGILCRLRLDGHYKGWGVFRPTSPVAATRVRCATLAEQRRYLDLLPRRQVILCEPHAGSWEAWPAHHGDRRFGPPTLLPVRFVEDGQAFEVVETRFDGAQAWFDRTDACGDPAAATYLRESLRQDMPPQRLQRRGLSGEARVAYAQVFARRQAVRRDHTEDRLRAALAHAGAELGGYVERADGYRVEYAVDGQRHVSVVNKDDLAVQLAGVCLSGEDGHFDLASLVGVLREAAGGALRIGDDGMAEEQYWQVHPRR
jgi:hypothetical protein